MECKTDYVKMTKEICYEKCKPTELLMNNLCYGNCKDNDVPDGTKCINTIYTSPVIKEYGPCPNNTDKNQYNKVHYNCVQKCNTDETRVDKNKCKRNYSTTYDRPFRIPLIVEPTKKQ